MAKSELQKAGAPRMSLGQLERANVKRLQPYFNKGGPDSIYLGQKPSSAAMQQVFEEFGSPGHMQESQGKIARKLLKKGGSIRLPQMSKAMLPMMLLALLAGGLGMGMGSDRNEEIDALLG